MSSSGESKRKKHDSIKGVKKKKKGRTAGGVETRKTPRKKLMGYISENKWDDLIAFVRSNQHLSPKLLEEIFLKSIAEDKRTVVVFLMEHVSKGALEKGLKLAVEKNQFSIFDLIVTSSDPAVSQRAKGEALKLAVEKDSVGLIRTILASTNPAVSQKAKGEALKLAAEKGSVEQLNMILASTNPVVHLKAKGEALKVAVGQGSEDLVRTMLASTNPAVSQKAKGEALRLAAEKGLVEQLNMILESTDPAVSQGAKNDTIDIAAEHGQQEVVKRLLETQDISQEVIEKALIAAVNKDQAEVAKFILDKGGCSVAVQERVREIALREGKSEEMQRVVQPLKGVLILGEDIEGSDLDSIKESYKKSGYLVIGNGKRLLSESEVRRELNGRIDSNTRIDVVAHGNLGSDGLTHKIGLLDEGSSKTKRVYKILDQISGGKPLHVHQWSCYAGAAAKDVKVLAEGSIVAAHGPEEYSIMAKASDVGMRASLEAYQRDESAGVFTQLVRNVPNEVHQDIVIGLKLSQDKSEVFKAASEVTDLLQMSSLGGALRAGVARFKERLIQLELEGLMPDHLAGSVDEVKNFIYDGKDINFFIRSYFNHQAQMGKESFDKYLLDNAENPNVIGYKEGDIFYKKNGKYHLYKETEGVTLSKDVLTILEAASRDNVVYEKRGKLYRCRSDSRRLSRDGVRILTDSEKEKLLAEAGVGAVAGLKDEVGIIHAPDNATSPLIMATKEGRAKTVKILLKIGRYSEKTKLGVLAIAQRRGHVETAEEIAKSIEVGVETLKDLSVDGKHETVKLVVQEAGVGSQRAAKNALKYAIDNNNVALAEVILNSGDKVLNQLSGEEAKKLIKRALRIEGDRDVGMVRALLTPVLVSEQTLRELLEENPRLVRGGGRKISKIQEELRFMESGYDVDLTVLDGIEDLVERKAVLEDLLDAREIRKNLFAGEEIDYEKIGELSQNQINNLFKMSVELGKVDLAERIFSQILQEGVDQQILADALLAAVRNGHQDLAVSILYNQGYMLKQEAVNDALYIAAQRGDCDEVINTMFVEGTMVPVEVVDRAASIAFENKNYDSLQSLLYDISEEKKSELFLDALRGGDTGLVSELLKTDVNEEALIDGVNLLAAGSSADQIDPLLAHVKNVDKLKELLTSYANLDEEVYNKVKDRIKELAPDEVVVEFSSPTEVELSVDEIKSIAALVSINCDYGGKRTRYNHDSFIFNSKSDAEKFKKDFGANGRINEFGDGKYMILVGEKNMENVKTRAREVVKSISPELESMKGLVSSVSSRSAPISGDLGAPVARRGSSSRVR